MDMELQSAGDRAVLPTSLVCPLVRPTLPVRAERLAAAARQVLVEEAELTPKPGLVDRRGRGAHADMSLEMMRYSAAALEPWFAQMALLAESSSVGIELREELGELGRAAEKAMLLTTGGVNTHRGAIWSLGLLTAAAAHLGEATPTMMCATAGLLATMFDRRAPRASTRGEFAWKAYGAAGARGEAGAGFPHVLEVGLPALQAAREAGMHEDHARLQALLAIMASAADTCVLHRGGPLALEVVHAGAQRALELGGCSTAEGTEAVRELDRSLLRLWVSPGGSADLLAATMFVDRVAPAAGRCA